MNVSTAVEVLAVTLLGLQAGATAAEGAVLVPFWRSMQPAAFLGWYREHAALLLKFFGPLEAAAAVSTIAATALAWRGSAPALWSWTGAAACAVAVLIAFPLYFQRVNASFAEGTIEVSRVPAELARWSACHWIRVGFALAAFVLAVFALTAARLAAQLPTNSVLTSS